MALVLVLACTGAGPGRPGASEELADATRKLLDWNTPPGERTQALETLRKAGTAGHERVRGLLRSPAWPARRDAVVLASGGSHPELGRILAEALADRNWLVRSTAASTAAELEGEARAPVRERLLSALEDPVAPVRFAAYQTLAAWEPEGGYVLSALMDPDRGISYWAAKEYVEHADVAELTPAARARLVDGILAWFEARGWTVDATGTETLFALGRGATDALYTALQAESTWARRQAVSNIGSVARRKAVPLMFRFLYDPDNGVRNTAMSMIASHATNEHAPRLLALLRTTNDPNLQGYALSALGRLKCREAIPDALRLASTWHSGLSQRAVQALAAMGDKDVAPKLIALYWRQAESWRRSQMVQPIAQLLGHDGADFLAQALRDADRSVRTQVLRAARSYLKNEDRTKLIRRAIRQVEDDHVRSVAIRYLNREEALAAFDDLAEALKTGAENTRAAAAHALGMSGAPRGIEVLVETFETESDPNVRQALLQALTQVRNREVAPFLRKALRSKDPALRAAALNGLARFQGALGDRELVGLMVAEDDEQVLTAAVQLANVRNLAEPRLVPVLSRLLRSADNGVRHAAAACLGRLRRPEALSALCKVLEAESYPPARTAAVVAVVDALASRAVSPAALRGPLQAALKSPAAEVRVQIITALSQTGDREAALLLLRVLREDGSATVRRAAAEGARRLAGKDIVPRLLDIARREEDVETLVVLIDTLKELGDRRAVPFFRKALESGEAKVQAAALDAIGVFRDAALVPFYVDQFTRSTSDEVRLNALANMKGAGDRRTLEVLLRALKDENEEVRNAALAALADFADVDVAAALSEQLLRPDLSDAQAEAVIGVLGRVRSRRVADELLAAAGDEERGGPVPARVLRALGQMGDRRAVPLLAAALKDHPSGEARTAAAAGLAELGASDQVTLCLEVAQEAVGSARRAAIEAAIRLGDPAALEGLVVEAFRDGTLAEKRACARALARRDDRVAEDVIARRLARETDPRLLAALCEAHSGGAGARVARAGAGDVPPRVAAAAVAALEPGPESERMCLAILASSRPASVRAAALLAWTRSRLRSGDTGDLADRIAAGLSAGEAELAIAGLRAAAMIPEKERAKQLLPAVVALAKQDDDPELAREAVSALGRMADGPAAEAALLEILREGERDLPAAVRSLGMVHSLESVPELVSLSEGAEPELRSVAVEALGLIGTDEAVAAVLGAYRQENVDAARAEAARALGRLRRADQAGELAGALRTAPGVEVRAACAEALGRLGGAAAKDALIEALGQDSGAVREAALRALHAADASVAVAHAKELTGDPDVGVARAATELAGESSGGGPE